MDNEWMYERSWEDVKKEFKIPDNCDEVLKQKYKGIYKKALITQLDKKYENIRNMDNWKPDSLWKQVRPMFLPFFVAFILAGIFEVIKIFSDLENCGAMDIYYSTFSVTAYTLLVGAYLVPILLPIGIIIACLRIKKNDRNASNIGLTSITIKSLIDARKTKKEMKKFNEDLWKNLD